MLAQSTQNQSENRNRNRCSFDSRVETATVGSRTLPRFSKKRFSSEPDPEPDSEPGENRQLWPPLLPRLLGMSCYDFSGTWTYLAPVSSRRSVAVGVAQRGLLSSVILRSPNILQGDTWLHQKLYTTAINTAAFSLCKRDRLWWSQEVIRAFVTKWCVICLT